MKFPDMLRTAFLNLWRRKLRAFISAAKSSRGSVLSPAETVRMHWAMAVGGVMR